MDILWSPWRNQYVTAEERQLGCVFCRLAQGEGEEFDASHFVLFRGQSNFIVLNLFPYNTAHLMIIPYAHLAILSDVAKETTDEMMDLAKRAQEIIQIEYKPDGYNLGMNLGKAAGAGVAEHLHLHVMPRWSGDANFMTTIGETRVLSESLPDTYRRLKKHFA